MVLLIWASCVLDEVNNWNKIFNLLFNRPAIYKILCDVCVWIIVKCKLRFLSILLSSIFFFVSHQLLLQHKVHYIVSCASLLGVFSRLLEFCTLLCFCVELFVLLMLSLSFMFLFILCIFFKETNRETRGLCFYIFLFDYFFLFIYFSFPKINLLFFFWFCVLFYVLKTLPS